MHDAHAPALEEGTAAGSAARVQRPPSRQAAQAPAATEGAAAASSAAGSTDAAAASGGPQQGGYRSAPRKKLTKAQLDAMKEVEGLAPFVYQKNG